MVKAAMSLRAAVYGAPHLEGDIMRKPIRCMLGRHHNVWKSNPDGDRYKQCSRCGRDDPGAAITGGMVFEVPVPTTRTGSTGVHKL